MNVNIFNRERNTNQLKMDELFIYLIIVFIVFENEWMQMYIFKRAAISVRNKETH